jgi:hypothetical protein
MTVGQATAVALGRLNEHPRVSSVTAFESRTFEIESVTAVVVSIPYLSFDIVEVVRLSDSARSKNLGFFAIIDTCEISWMFSDFGPKHIVDAHTPPLKRDDTTGERKAVNRIEEYEFCDFKMYIESPIDNSKYWVIKPSVPSDVFLFVHLFMKWRLGDSKLERSPKRLRRDTKSEDIDNEDFEKFVSKYLKENSRVKSIDRICSMVKLLNEPSNPYFAAIHGALVTQELIKFVTKKDSPLVNTISMNVNDGGAIVVKQPGSLRYYVHETTEKDEVEEVRVNIAGSIDVLE